MLRMVITNTFIPRDRKNTVVNLMIMIFSPARIVYFTKFQNLIFDLKVMRELTMKPKITVTTAAKITE